MLGADASQVVLPLVTGGIGLLTVPRSKSRSGASCFAALFGALRRVGGCQMQLRFGRRGSVGSSETFLHTRETCVADFAAQAGSRLPTLRRMLPYFNSDMPEAHLSNASAR